MNSPELVIWLVPGYLILLLYRRVYPSRSKQGWEWVIQTTVAAVACYLGSRVLLAIGRALTTVILPQATVNWFRAWWAGEFPFRYSFSLAIGFLLIVPAAWLICRIAPLFHKVGDKFAKAFPVRQSSDMFYSECYTMKDAPVFVTLDTGKVYIGILNAFTNDIDEPERFIKIVPILSGYREEKTLLPVITTDYIGEVGDADDVRAEPILIPAKHITSMTKFSMDLMNRFIDQGTTKLAFPPQEQLHAAPQPTTEH